MDAGSFKRPQGWMVTEKTPDGILMTPVRRITDCPACGSKQVVRFGGRQRKVFDLPSDGVPVVIFAESPRCRCKDCQKVFPVPTPGLSEGKMTDRLTHWILEEAGRSTFGELAAQCGVSQSSVYHTFVDMAEKADKEVQYRAGKLIGFAGTSHLPFQGVFVINLEEERLMDVLPADASIESSLAAFAKKWPDSQCILVPRDPLLSTCSVPNMIEGDRDGRLTWWMSRLNSTLRGLPGRALAPVRARMLHSTRARKMANEYGVPLQTCVDLFPPRKPMKPVV